MAQNANNRAKAASAGTSHQTRMATTFLVSPHIHYDFLNYFRSTWQAKYLW